MQASDQQQLVDALIPLSRAAGRLIMDIYHSDFAVRGKADASPVTEADEKAEAIILEGLAALSLSFPVVAEEACAAGNIPDVDDRFWLVDPLDGTREFVNRNGEFTVNIALIEHGRPILGVVLAPALDQLYTGSLAGGRFTRTVAGDTRFGCASLPLMAWTFWPAALTAMQTHSSGCWPAAGFVT